MGFLPSGTSTPNAWDVLEDEEDVALAEEARVGVAPADEARVGAIDAVELPTDEGSSAPAGGFTEHP